MERQQLFLHLFYLMNSQMIRLSMRTTAQYSFKLPEPAGQLLVKKVFLY